MVTAPQPRTAPEIPWTPQRRVEESMRLSPELRSASIARRALRSELEGSIGRDLLERTELVLSELVTNAAEACEPDDTIIADWSLETDCVTVVVSNAAGDHATPAVATAIPVDSVRGRGLFIASAVSDSLSIQRDVDSIVLTAVLKR